jgi:hypothetical protein
MLLEEATNVIASVWHLAVHVSLSWRGLEMGFPEEASTEARDLPEA